MSSKPLIQPLFPGPVDVVADIHGEIDALRDLLGHLGYDEVGVHPQGRRLVFLGDLVDRGPDSPAVVRVVSALLDAGRGQAVLGNHELNLLQGKEKKSAGNAWFFGNKEALDPGGPDVPQVLANDEIRRQARELFLRLPLALERNDLRVVHACWDTPSIDRLRQDTDVLRTHDLEAARIDEELNRFQSDRDLARVLAAFGASEDDAAGVFLADPMGGRDRLREAIGDSIGWRLARQNWNAVKLVTSGPERRAVKPFFKAGKWRDEARMPWWPRYRDATWCVIGHYWRQPLGDEDDAEHLFDPSRPYAMLGNGNVTCIDYSVGKRWRERLDRGTPWRTRLAALRWPEKQLYFDSGEMVPL